MLTVMSVRGRSCDGLSNTGSDMLSLTHFAIVSCFVAPAAKSPFLLLQSFYLCLIFKMKISTCVGQRGGLILVLSLFNFRSVLFSRLLRTPAMIIFLSVSDVSESFSNSSWWLMTALFYCCIMKSNLFSGGYQLVTICVECGTLSPFYWGLCTNYSAQSLALLRRLAGHLKYPRSCPRWN